MFMLIKIRGLKLKLTRGQQELIEMKIWLVQFFDEIWDAKRRGCGQKGLEDHIEKNY